MHIDQIYSDLKFTFFTRITAFLVAVFMMIVSVCLITKGNNIIGGTCFIFAMLSFFVMNQWLSNRVNYLLPFINQLEEEI